ncbi:hypothetical protein C2S51_000306 [Perilla frutescens var. frutescens]|nr:hypothetical protein C2S51_000306 [Perilla frutescens var. frutescens]
MTKLMDLVLEDLKGNTITCNLWENYVDDVINFLDSGPEAPVGIIMQLCQPNIFRGEVRVSTLFNVTMILTDQKLEEIAEFTFRLIPHKTLYRLQDRLMKTKILLLYKK